MKHNTIKLTAAAIALAAIAALSGCSGSTSEIDLSLIGGEANTESRTDSVDIRHDSSDNEEAEVSSAPVDSKADEPVNSGTISGAEHVEPVIISDPDSSDPEDIADDDTPKEETRPDVTTAPDLETASEVAADPDDSAEENDPAVTVTTDRKDADPEDDQIQPTVTTASTTTHKQETQDPQENELDSDGFPNNPVNNQKYTDSTGQKWTYDSIFGWIMGGGEVIVEDFPTFEVEDGDKQILF